MAADGLANAMNALNLNSADLVLSVRNLLALRVCGFRLVIALCELKPESAPVVDRQAAKLWVMGLLPEACSHGKSELWRMPARLASRKWCLLRLGA